MSSTTSVSRDPTSPSEIESLPVNAKAVTVMADGVRLAANWWTPPHARPDQLFPTILMIHGWGGTKAHLNRAYAPHFAAEGFNVFTFDFRGWGESDGELRAARPIERGADPRAPFTTTVIELRDIVDPLVEYRDIQACIHWLRGQPGIDWGRMVLWGSSLGGGLALQTALDYPEFGFLITQIAASNSRANWGPDVPANPLNTNAVARWQSAIARGEAPGVPGPEARMGELKGYPHYPALVPWDPFARIDQLEAEVLVIDADDEELFDAAQNGGLLYKKMSAKGRGTFHSFPGQHYDLYNGEGYRQCLNAEIAWLSEKVVDA